MNEYDGPPAPAWAKFLAVAAIAVMSLGAGYWFRIYQETHSPVVISILDAREREQHLTRFKGIAAQMADSLHLQDNKAVFGTFVYLVQRFAHPCVLEDKEIRFQIKNIIALANGVELQPVVRNHK